MASLQKLIRQYFESEFYRNIFRLFSGMVAARLFPSLFALIIVRIYSPENFGTFVLYLTIASAISILATGKYEHAIILSDQPKQRSHIFNFCLKLSLRINGLILIFIVLYLWLCAYHTKTSPILLLLIPVYAYFFAGLQLVRQVLISEKAFKRLSYLEVWRSIATGILQCLLFLYPETGLFIGAVLAQAFIFIIYINQLPKRTFLPGFRFEEEELFLAKRYVNFPKYSVASEILNFTSSQLPILLIKPFFGANMLGQYSFPHRYLSMPVQLFSQSVSQVYVKEIQSMKDNLQNLSKLSNSLFHRQVWLSLPPFAILMLWGEEIFGFLFGPTWAFAGQLAQYIAPWLFAVAVSSPLSSILIVLEKQRESLLFNSFLIVFRIATLLIGIFVLQDIEWTIALYSITGFVFFVLLGGYSLHLVGVPRTKVLRFCAKVVLIISLPLILLKLWL